MKKKLISILLALTMLIPVGLLACKQDQGEQGEQGMLTAEQQVQIAKDTFNGIYEASQNQQAQMMTLMGTDITSLMTLTETDNDFISSLFSKYEDKVRESDKEGTLIQFNYQYRIFTQPLEALLHNVGVATLNYEYEVEYNVTNDEYNVVSSLPNKLSFHGVKEENGYNKVYSTSVVSENNVKYTCISYYKSDTDYGFEVIMEIGEGDGKSLLYANFDMLTDKIEFISTGEDGSVVSNLEALYFTDLTEEDIDLIIEIAVNAKSEMTTYTQDLEKEINNGILKTAYSEKIILDFDISKLEGTVDKE